MGGGPLVQGPLEDGHPQLAGMADRPPARLDGIRVEARVLGDLRELPCAGADLDEDALRLA